MPAETVYSYGSRTFTHGRDRNGILYGTVAPIVLVLTVFRVRRAMAVKAAKAVPTLQLNALSGWTYHEYV